MTPDEFTELKHREEAKRDKQITPAQRLHFLQEMIALTEAQLPPEKRRNRPRWKTYGTEPN